MMVPWRSVKNLNLLVKHVFDGTDCFYSALMLPSSEPRFFLTRDVLEQFRVKQQIWGVLESQPESADSSWQYQEDFYVHAQVFTNLDEIREICAWGELGNG